MTNATRERASPHARIYSSWVELPTWRALSPTARALLVEILARFRPGENGALEWPVRRAADVLGVSKATGARSLSELERNGWLSVARVGKFGGKAKPATYALAMFKDDAAGELASMAFEHLPGEPYRVPRKRQSRQADKTVPPLRLNGFTGGTGQSRGRDKPALDNKRMQIADVPAEDRISKPLGDRRRAGAATARESADAATDISIELQS